MVQLFTSEMIRVEWFLIPSNAHSNTFANHTQRQHLLFLFAFADADKAFVFGSSIVNHSALMKLSWYGPCWKTSFPCGHCVAFQHMHWLEYENMCSLMKAVKVIPCATPLSWRTGDKDVIPLPHLGKLLKHIVHYVLKQQTNSVSLCRVKSKIDIMAPNRNFAFGLFHTLRQHLWCSLPTALICDARPTEKIR